MGAEAGVTSKNYSGRAILSKSVNRYLLLVTVWEQNCKR